MAATTTLLGLVTPTQGTLSGTWGDTVNYGISDYVDISVAGTLTLTNDGAVTLANTTGSSSGNSITSSLTGAGTVTAQFAIVKVTGTLTVAKVVTGPSYSKTYTVVNSATGGIVTFKASGQTGVSVAVGESAFVYYNGTDYVKVSGTVAVASFQTSLGGLTPSTATTGVVTLAGTLNTTSGGTGLTSFTAGDVPYYASGSVLSKLAIGTAGQFLTSTGTAPQWSTLSGVAVTTFSAGTTGFTPSSATSGAVTLAGTLATTNGGTGLTSFTSGGVVYASSASVLATGSALTFDGANLGIAATVTGNSFTQYSNSADGGLIGFVGNAKALFGGSPPTSSLGVRGETNILFGISSTEAMRLTSSSLYTASGINVGFGTSSPAAKLHVKGGTTISTLAGWNTLSNSMFELNNPAVRFGIGYDSSDQVLLQGFDTSNAARNIGMQVYGGNVGIGTSSPVANFRLTTSSSVDGLAGIYIENTNTGTSASAVTRFKNSGTTSAYSGLSGVNRLSYAGLGPNVLAMYTDSTAGIALTVDAAGPITFNTNATERARITSDGNFGLGVTPSAWGAGLKAIQIGPQSCLNSGDTAFTAATRLSTNAYSEASAVFKRIDSGFATSYYQQSGVHYWETAGSSTAGSTISFTQAMTLTAAGELLVGTTSASGIITTSANVNSASGAIFTRNINASSGSYSGLIIGNNITSNYAGFLLTSSGQTSSGFFGPNSVYAYAGAGQMAIVTEGAYPLIFGTSGTERARIDSSGNLLVGATAVGNGGKLYVNGSISLGTTTTGTQSSMAKDTTQQTVSVSTSATTIYTDISSGMSSASAGYFIIYGNNNTGAGFMDVVIAKASGTPVVVSSSTVEGSPPARTYSVSSFALQLTMASGTFNVNLKATVIGYPH